MYGELIPFGGGDPIPLVKPRLLIGRRESCDIVLRFPNISAHHCELELDHGYWFVNDLNSRNGTKVNGLRVTARRRVDPGDRLAIAKHNYEVRYSPADLGAEGPPPDVAALEDVLAQSLMKGAGLERREQQERAGRIGVRRPQQTQPQPAAAAPGEGAQAAEEDDAVADAAADDTDGGGTVGDRAHAED